MRSALFLLAACSGKTVVPEEVPLCDGILQEGEGTIDAPFDEDADGYFDAQGPGCAKTYDEYILDCDDEAFDRHPDAPELPCNGIDDDCNDDTPDALDHDADGSIMCDDCDDSDGTRAPGLPETCWDQVDNDCDGVIDPDCGYDYNGRFVLETPLQYSCARILDVSLIDIDVSSVTVLYIPPYTSITSNQSIQPGTLNGEINTDGTFILEASNALMTIASCDEYYRLTGTFIGPDRFEATFESVFNGVCLNCQNQTIPGIVGVRKQ